MPTDIHLADGKLADWHRFDAFDRAVTKDRSILMSVADSRSNSLDQIKTIWEKLGGTNTPPRVDSFNRDDLAKNKASQVPAQLPTPTVLFSGTTFIAFWLDLNFDIGGSAPTGIEYEAAPTLGGATITGTHVLTYPYFWLGTYYVWVAGGLTSGTQYSIRGRLVNSFGSGAWSTPTIHSAA